MTMQKKNEKALYIDMEFEEAMQRLTNDAKSKLEANIKRQKKKKNKDQHPD